MFRPFPHWPSQSSLLVLLILSIFSCSKPVPSLNKYVGIIDNDSVTLEVRLYETQFSGQLTYRSNGRVSKTGKIQGQISADTLLGDFHYSAYGAKAKRTPIALIRTTQGYSIGKGVTSDYMGIPYFVKDVPIEYDTLQPLVPLQ